MSKNEQGDFMFKRIILLAVIAGVVFIGGVVAAGLMSKPGVTNKEEIEKVVHGYIMENPMLILTAIEEHQRRTTQERLGAAISEFSEDLFNDKDAPVAGNLQGDVVMVEFFDYNCGYCKRALPDVEAVLNDDKNVRVVFKEFPILGPSSELAARYALAAARQDKYLDFHRELMSSRGAIDEAMLERVATNLKMDITRLKKDAQDPEITAIINKNRELAVALGISGTPAFVIGSELVPGAVGAARMKEIIAEQRAAAR